MEEFQFFSFTFHTLSYLRYERAIAGNRAVVFIYLFIDEEHSTWNCDPIQNNNPSIDCKF